MPSTNENEEQQPKVSGRLDSVGGDSDPSSHISAFKAVASTFLLSNALAPTGAGAQSSCGGDSSDSDSSDAGDGGSESDCSDCTDAVDPSDSNNNSSSDCDGDDNSDDSGSDNYGYE